MQRKRDRGRKSSQGLAPPGPPGFIAIPQGIACARPSQHSGRHPASQTARVDPRLSPPLLVPRSIIHAEASRMAPAADPFTRLSSDVSIAILQRLNFSDRRVAPHSTACTAVPPSCVSAACAVHIPDASRKHWRVLRIRAACVSRALRAVVHGEDSDLLERPVVPSSRVARHQGREWVAHGTCRARTQHHIRLQGPQRPFPTSVRSAVKQMYYWLGFRKRTLCGAASSMLSGPLCGGMRVLLLPVCWCIVTPHPGTALHAARCRCGGEGTA